MVLWEDKQNWQTIGQTHQEKKGEDSNQQNWKEKGGGYNRWCKKYKYHTWILWATISQWNGQPGINNKFLEKFNLQDWNKKKQKLWKSQSQALK